MIRRMFEILTFSNTGCTQILLLPSTVVAKNERRSNVSRVDGKMVLLIPHMHALLAFSVVVVRMANLSHAHLRPVETATVKVWMRGGGWRNTNCNGGGAVASLCLSTENERESWLDTLTRATVTRGRSGWSVRDKNQHGTYCFPDWKGHCFEMKQVGISPDHLEVTFDVENTALPGKEILNLDFMWSYGCCGWDLWQGNCLHQANKTNRWIAEVFMGECETPDGRRGKLAIKDLVRSDGRFDNTSGKLRWTPYLKSGRNYCHDQTQGFEIELLCDV